MISVSSLGFVETVLPCDLLAWQAFSFTIVLSSAFVAGREELSFFSMCVLRLLPFYPRMHALRCFYRWNLALVWRLAFILLFEVQTVQEKAWIWPFFATTFFLLCMEKWVIEARGDALHGSSGFFV